MILVWDNAQAFRQHVEDMKTFRQSHSDIARSELSLFKGKPPSYDVRFPCNTGGSSQLIKTGGKTIIVPIWKIVLSQGSQN